MRHPGIMVGSLLALTVLVGCGSSEETRPAVERSVVDGVEVVTSRRPSWSDDGGWSLESEPEVAIGETEEEPRYLFSIIRGPIRLPDGVIVAGDHLTRELRFFDDSGEHVRTVGGHGEAPGELGLLNGVHRCGADAIYVVDLGREELSVFDFAGRLLDRHPFETNAGVELYPGLSCNDRGQLLAMDWGNVFAEGVRQVGHYRSTVHFWLLDREGFVVRDFGEFPGVDFLLTSRGGGPHPLGKVPARVLGDERAYIGTADDFEIQVWSLEGELLQRLRRPVDARTITEADIERYVQFATRDAEEAEEQRRNPVDAENSPATFPAYSRFLLDRAEHLWVENYRPPWAEGERRVWSVFDPGGVWLGDVEVPSRFEITEIGGDHVLGVFRDELDQQSVRLYRLLRDAG